MAGRNFNITSEICVKITTSLLKLTKVQERQLGFPEGMSLNHVTLEGLPLEKFLTTIVYFTIPL